jgi:arylsulfatase A-like enzyme
VIHVPLFFYFPPEDRAGRRVPQNVANLDILPTVNDYLGLPTDEGNEGMSLMPLIRGSEAKNNERYIYSHLYRMRPEVGHQTSRATVYDKWKFIQLLDGEKKLFDLAADPREQENQIDRDPEVANTLEEQFLRFENVSNKYPSETLDYYLSRQELERLEALGYVRQ